MKHLYCVAAMLMVAQAVAGDSLSSADASMITRAGEDGTASATASVGSRPRGAASTLRYGMDHFMLEAGALRDAPAADAVHALRGSAFVLWQPDRQWEFRAGARITGDAQRGGAAGFTKWNADLTDTYVRWRSGGTRVTLGAQTVLWGRADEVPLIDRVSRVDLTRLVLDELPERRRAQWALRWEQSWGEVKLEAVALPRFRGAGLPALESVWSPVNQTTGQVAGIAPTPALAAFVRAARVVNDDGGSGGLAVRLTRTGEPFDVGLTLARTRQSVPYYRANTDPANPTLTGIHPYQNFAGVDAEWVTGDLTWRSELGYTTDVPATLPTAAMVTTDAVEWIGGVEFFPGGGDTRLTLQLLARSRLTSQDVLELKRYLGVNGEVDAPFDQGRWRVGARFAAGLNVNDLYVGPVLRFVGWEPHEFYVAAHFFGGEARTLGGFHRNHDLIAVGLRTRF